jgi:hypothetical protein
MDVQEELADGLANGSDRFGGGAGGGAPTPRGAIGGLGALIFLGGSIWVFNNALFNGTERITTRSVKQSNTMQWMVAIEQSNILGYQALARTSTAKVHISECHGSRHPSHTTSAPNHAMSLLSPVLRTCKW